MRVHVDDIRALEMLPGPLQQHGDVLLAEITVARTDSNESVLTALPDLSAAIAKYFFPHTVVQRGN
ncbi:hypothetical protein GCM10009864_47780 [Streptomyces lunalinharesii]|uniref:Uncharacterized protein n=1 Tax=Streptomyces lunalinharesii TaxID=333384 RepID=A0ABN3SC08_9ACTN